MKSLLKMTLILLLVTGLGNRASADNVVPKESVDTFVNIRFAPDAQSEVVGHLQQGSRLRHLRTVDGWHEVALEGGGTGYISADWSLLVGDEGTASAATTDQQPESTAEAGAETGGKAVAEAEPAPKAESEPDEVAPGAAAGIAAAAEPAEAHALAIEEAEVAEALPDTSAADAAKPAAVAMPDTPPGPPETGVEPAPADSSLTEEVAEPDAAVAEPVDADPPVVAEAVPVVPSYAAPSAKTNVEGSVDHLARFIATTELANSQVFDNGRNVGIGTNDPRQRLEVNGNIQIHEQNSNVAGLIISQSSGDSGYIMHNRASTLTIGAGSVDRITITRDGNTGFGVNHPSHPIEMSSGAHVTAGGVWTNSSSREKKENVKELTPGDALSALAALQPVQFNYKADDTEQYVGFIAEDVPELVATSDRTGLSAMDIVAVLTSVVQQQQKRIDRLEARLNDAIPGQ